MKIYESLDAEFEWVDGELIWEQREVADMRIELEF